MSDLSRGIYSTTNLSECLCLYRFSGWNPGISKEMFERKDKEGRECVKINKYLVWLSIFI